jgi:hypothetical protein
MATVTASYNWVSGETVTPAKLNTTAAPTVVVADNEVTTAKISDATSTTTGITNAKLRHSAALSVVGRSANSAGAPADITAATDGEVFRRSGTSVGFGQVATAGIADDAVTNDKLSLSANAGEVKKAINADNDPPIFACRAWVNFDATRDSSGASNTSNTNRFIRASGNVSSVEKTATGVFTITFTTAMPDENYAMCGFANWSTSNPAGVVGQNNTFAPAAGSCVIRVFGSSTAAENNVSHNHVIFIR